jgi:hypothetical protein
LWRQSGRGKSLHQLSAAPNDPPKLASYGSQDISIAHLNMRVTCPSNNVTAVAVANSRAFGFVWSWTIPSWRGPRSMQPFADTLEKPDSMLQSVACVASVKNRLRVAFGCMRCVIEKSNCVLHHVAFGCFLSIGLRPFLRQSRDATRAVHCQILPPADQAGACWS